MRSSNTHQQPIGILTWAYLHSVFYIVDYAANKEEPDYTLLRYEAMIEVRVYVYVCVTYSCVCITSSYVHKYIHITVCV